MLKKILKLIGIVVLVFGAYTLYGTFINPKSPKDVVTHTKEDLNIEVVYHRPFKKERLIFGEQDNGALVPYGKYWRLGANAATTFEVNKDIAFAGRLLPAGQYRMYAIPQADHWIVVLNEEAGAFGYMEPDYDKDIMRVNIASAQLMSPLEQFTIDFLDDEDTLSLRMRWDTTAISIPIN
ncbi:MAG: DUF2911 domain-containing protein [Flavobacteriaceae bacterium]